MSIIDANVMRHPVTPPDNGAWSYSWNDITQPVSTFLEQVVTNLTAQSTSFHPEITSVTQYALANPGKLIRSTLLGLSAQALELPLDEEKINLAVVIEMIHLATLLHDDVMDSASIRRKIPTLAAKWSSQLSILIGDCLFAQSMKLATRFGDIEACRSIADAVNRVCLGEALQTQQRKIRWLEREEYLKLLEMKTAELFSLACQLGSKAPQNENGSQDLQQFGIHLGIAYQLYDDCIDLFGRESQAGKSLGTDLATGKWTLPLILVREQASPADRTRLEHLSQHWQPDHHPELLQLLDRYEARHHALHVLSNYFDLARKNLGELPGTPASQALHRMVDYFQHQTQVLVQNQPKPGNFNK